MSQDSTTSICSICTNECLKIYPYLCAAYVRMPSDSPIPMCTVCMTALTIAHILHVQDTHKYQRHDDRITNLLYTQHRRSTVSSYLHSPLPVNEMTTGATSAQIPCDININIKCSGMLCPVTDFSTKRNAVIITVTQEGTRVLRNVANYLSV